MSIWLRSLLIAFLVLAPIRLLVRFTDVNVPWYVFVGLLVLLTIVLGIGSEPERLDGDRGAEGESAR